MKKMITLAFMMVFSANLGMAMNSDWDTGIKSLLENYHSQDIPEVKASPAYSIGFAKNSPQNFLRNSLNKAYQRLSRMGLNGITIHVDDPADLVAQIKSSRVPLDYAVALAADEYMSHWYVLSAAEEVVSDNVSDAELDKAVEEYIRFSLIKTGISVMMLDFDGKMRKYWTFEISHFTGGVSFYFLVDRYTGKVSSYTQD